MAGIEKAKLAELYAMQQSMTDTRTIVEEFAKGYMAELEKLDRKMDALAAVRVTPADLQSRLEALELWKGKVHSLLVEVTPTGKERPTKRGRTLGAMLGNGGLSSQNRG